MPQSEALGDSSPLGISTLFRSLGGWGTVSGPGMFMVRTLAVGSASGPIPYISTFGSHALQAVGGVAGAILGTLMFGTGALPFIFGASLCFAGGMMAYYRSCLAQAFLALERHPRLLLLHLDLNYPVYRWNQKRIGTILEGRERAWVEEGMLISSWQTAGPALDEIHAQREGAIVASIVQED